jgi:hypothetical protein
MDSFLYNSKWLVGHPHSLSKKTLHSPQRGYILSPG